MRLVCYLIGKRTKSYFSFAENWKGMGADLLFAFLCFFYAAGFIILNRHAGNYMGTGINMDSLLRGLMNSLFVMPVIFTVFPGFSLKKPLVGAQFPLSRIQVALTDLIAICLYKTRNAILILFVFIITGFKPQWPVEMAIVFILILVLGILTAENIRNAISWKQYFSFSFSVALACATGLLIHKYSGHIIVQVRLGISLLLVMILISTVIYLLGYQTRLQTPSAGADRKVSKSIASRSSFGLLFRMSVRNSSLTLVLLIAFAVKAVIMLCFLFRGYDNLGMVIEKVPFIVCLFLPIILFTYIYNNAWGYFYSVALNNLIGPAQARIHINTYFKLILPALITDACITFFCLELAGLLDLKIVVVYFISVLFCIPVGIVSSFSRYMPVNAALDFTQFRGKTSRMYTVIILLPGMAIGLAYNHELILNIMLAVVFLISVILYASTLKKMPGHIDRLKRAITAG